MGKIIIHKLSHEELIAKREQEFLMLNYAQRFQKAIDLMRISFLFNNTNNLKNKNKILIKQ